MNRHFNKADTTVILEINKAGKSKIVINSFKGYWKFLYKIYVFMIESNKAWLENNVFDI